MGQKKWTGVDDNYKFINLSRFLKKRMKMDGLEKQEKRVRTLLLMGLKEPLR